MLAAASPLTAPLSTRLTTGAMTPASSTAARLRPKRQLSLPLPDTTTPPRFDSIPEEDETCILTPRAPTATAAAAAAAAAAAVATGATATAGAVAADHSKQGALAPLPPQGQPRTAPAASSFSDAGGCRTPRPSLPCHGGPEGATPMARAGSAPTLVTDACVPADATGTPGRPRRYTDPAEIQLLSLSLEPLVLSTTAAVAAPTVAVAMENAPRRASCHVAPPRPPAPLLPLYSSGAAEVRGYDAPPSHEKLGPSGRPTSNGTATAMTTATASASHSPQFSHVSSSRRREVGVRSIAGWPRSSKLRSSRSHSDDDDHDDDDDDNYEMVRGGARRARQDRARQHRRGPRHSAAAAALVEIWHAHEWACESSLAAFRRLDMAAAVASLTSHWHHLSDAAAWRINLSPELRRMLVDSTVLLLEAMLAELDAHLADPPVESLCDDLLHLGRHIGPAVDASLAELRLEPALVDELVTAAERFGACLARIVDVWERVVQLRLLSRLASSAWDSHHDAVLAEPRPPPPPPQDHHRERLAAGEVARQQHDLRPTRRSEDHDHVRRHGAKPPRHVEQAAEPRLDVVPPSSTRPQALRILTEVPPRPSSSSPNPAARSLYQRVSAPTTTTTTTTTTTEATCEVLRDSPVACDDDDEEEGRSSASSNEAGATKAVGGGGGGGGGERAHARYDQDATASPSSSSSSSSSSPASSVESSQVLYAMASPSSPSPPLSSSSTSSSPASSVDTMVDRAGEAEDDDYADGSRWAAEAEMGSEKESLLPYVVLSLSDGKEVK